VLQPRVYEGMRGGINTLVNAIRPTLGPIHRNVLNEKEWKIGRPEILDDGAVIARRIIQLEGRDEDMGAVYLRQMLWQLSEKVGDATTTAAVMFQAIYNG
jgi:chaperonin GroEL